MTEDEMYEEAHLNAEHEVREALYATFHDDKRRACRVDVLIEVLGDEFLKLDDVEEVSAAIYSLSEMIMLRAEQDGAMLAVEGRA